MDWRKGAYLAGRAELIVVFQITEMLSMFSSDASGTIGLAEFGRMAVMAHLI
jgi:hypothetical protein